MCCGRVLKVEKAAKQGHEKSQWIWNVVKDMESEWENENVADIEKALVKVFAETESPLGFYFAGRLGDWNSRERFEHFKRSSEGGCSWGQIQYRRYFDSGVEWFVERDENMYLELLGKAVA